MKDFEVIVIDNGSRDGCVDSLEQKWPGFHLHVERWSENRGFAAANNHGARLAKGKWLACLNADAFPKPDWAEQLLEAAESNCDFCVFSSRLINAGSPYLLDSAGDIYNLSGLARKRYRGYPVDRYGSNREEVFSACAAAALYNRDAFWKAGGFDDSFFSYYEDVDLGFRLQLLGYKCLYVPEAVVEHIGSSSAKAGSDFTIYYWQRNYIWTFFKNMPLPLLWMAFPAHEMSRILYFAYYMLQGRGGIMLKARMDALRSLPRILRMRAKIQKEIKIHISDLMNIMENDWSKPYTESWKSRKSIDVAQSTEIFKR